MLLPAMRGSSVEMSSRSSRVMAAWCASLTEGVCGAAVAGSVGTFLLPGVVPEVTTSGSGAACQSGPDSIGVFTEVMMQGYRWPFVGQIIFFFEATGMSFPESGSVTTRANSCSFENCEQPTSAKTVAIMMIIRMENEFSMPRFCKYCRKRNENARKKASIFSWLFPRGFFRSGEVGSGPIRA